MTSQEMGRREDLVANEALTEVEYLQFQARIDIAPSLNDVLSEEARHFLTQLHGGGTPAHEGDLASHAPWPEPARLAYDRLPRAPQAEVLCRLTLYLHELTHHLDYLTTPYGAVF